MLFFKRYTLYVILIVIIMMALQIRVFPQVNKTCIFFSADDPDDRDVILIEELEKKYEVSTHNIDDLQSGAIDLTYLQGFDFAFVSESVLTQKAAKLKGAPVPIFTTELWSSKWDVMGWVPTNTSPDYYGNTTTANETVIKIVNDNHPLAAGYTTGNEITLVNDSESQKEYLTYSVPQVDHIPIAVLTTDETKVIVMGVEEGIILYNAENVKDGSLVSQNRVTAVGIHSSANKFITPEAFKLIDAGIQWILKLDTKAPSAPQNLSANTGNQKVILTWSPNTETDIAYYKIYRSQTQGFTLTSSDSIAKVDHPDTSYVDTGLTNGHSYYYRISAVNIVGNESPYSEEVSAMPGLFPEIAVNPSELEFGDVKLHETKDMFLTISNPSSDTLNVTSITITSQFFTLLTGEVNFQVSPDDSQTVSVRFSPTVLGIQSGELKIYNNTENSPKIVSLTGNGVENTLSVLPNPFTPNNDGFNDYVSFEFPGLFTKHSEILIFDISGKRVSRLSNQSGNSYKWYGMNDNGGYLEPGVYIYMIRVDGKNQHSGTVTLMR